MTTQINFHKAIQLGKVCVTSFRLRFPFRISPRTLLEEEGVPGSLYTRKSSMKAENFWGEEAPEIEDELYVTVNRTFILCGMPACLMVPYCHPEYVKTFFFALLLHGQVVYDKTFFKKVFFDNAAFLTISF